MSATKEAGAVAVHDSPARAEIQQKYTTKLFEVKHAEDFLLESYEGIPGHVNVCYRGDGGVQRGEFFTTEPDGLRAAAEYAERLDESPDVAAVYFRCTTLREVPASGRGSAADTHAVPFLWSDIDYGTDGHAKPTGAPLPPTQADAELVLAESGLPEPTRLIHSGGGLYALWALPAPITDLDQAGRLSRGVQEALGDTAARHGWSYGTGVGDLARVLRLPGSVNRKVVGKPRPARVISGTGLAVDLDALPVPTPVVPAPRAPSVGVGLGGPFDALAATTTWAELFEPEGWTLVDTESSGAELWLRPGGSSSPYSARAFDHNVVVHSESAGLPSGGGQKLTKGRLFAHLHHDGDESAAAKDLIEAALGVGGTEAARNLPDHVLAAIKDAHTDRDAKAWARLGVDTGAVPTVGAQSTEGPGAGAPNSRDEAGEVLPGPDNPMAVVRELEDAYTRDGLLVVRHWRGAFMRWDTSRWVEVSNDAARSAAYGRLEHATYWSDTKEPRLKSWAPTESKVTNVLGAMRAVTHLSGATSPPCWLDDRGTGETIVSCANGLLVVRDRSLIEHSPAYFNQVAVPFAYTPEAETPTRWLKFLDDTFPNDSEAVATLQEWFGYVLSGRTHHQKILLIVGPTRSGKGTIARVLTGLVGEGNAAGPTLASLGTNFGLDPLRGKSLALISDARLGNRDNVATVVERLLSISGEDSITVDRKYREPWTGKLPARLMILSNELPRFGDSSGAITGRFIVLGTSMSFLGREDTSLSDALLTELPGVLNWSLDGLDRLEARGRFIMPTSSNDAIADLTELVSPISAFIDECCQLCGEISRDQLYAQWVAWAGSNGHRVTSSGTFGKDLRSAVPGLGQKRPAGEPRRYVGISLRSQVVPAPSPPALWASVCDPG